MQPEVERLDQIDPTPTEKISEYIEKQRDYFATGVTWDIDFRINFLKKLRDTIIAYEDRIVEAIQKDMSRPKFEAWGAEVGIVLEEIKIVTKSLRKWAKPRKIRTGLAFFKSSAAINFAPKGVTLVVSSWNYPFHLIFMPLVSSLSAGNTVILKPSELAVNSALLVEEIIDTVFPDGYVQVVQGGPEEGQELLKHKFDHILFTGSERVGRLYAQAACKFLTPITLEMGGKSPTIVHPSANLEVAAERIVYGKWVNSSQTCVAPDYILAHETVLDELKERIVDKIHEFYGKDPSESPDYARIINQHHFDRLAGLLKEVESEVIHGGNLNQDNLYIEPTLVDSPPLDTKIMNEEIFGPLLPIFSYNEFEEIKAFVANNPDPLVLYIFAEDNKFKTRVMQTIPSGDVAINDAALHFAIAGLPVGGVNTSGIGIYRGKYGFETFSHFKSVYDRATWVPINLIKPPYTSFKEKLLKFFLG